MANETTHQEENIDKKNGRVTKALLAAETRGDREGFDRLLAYSQHKPHADGRKKNTGAAFVRSLHIDMRLAEEDYGPGWLNS